VGGRRENGQENKRNRWNEKQTSCKAGKGVYVGAGAKIKC